MKNSRLIKILKTFSKEEFREFEKFTASPYFSRGRNLVPFLNILKKYYPVFDSDEFTNENIFSKLFPGKKFNEKNSHGVINTFSHELIKMCEEFLTISEMKEDINSKNYFLMKRILDKKLYNEFERIYKDASAAQEKGEGGSCSDFIDKYFLLDLKNAYSIATRDYKKTF